MGELREFFRAFRFICELHGEALHIERVEHTPAGVILTAAHAVGHPTLWAPFADGYDPRTRLVIRMLTMEAAGSVGITDPDASVRVVVYELGEGARHLAVACDAAANEVARDRVLFPNAVLVHVSDL